MSDPHADIAALADGSLPAGRRADVEARVAESPELQAALGRQRAALAAIAATEEDPAPARLRAWLRALGPATGDAGSQDAGRPDAERSYEAGPVRIRGRPGDERSGAFAPPPWRAGSAASAGSRRMPVRRRPLVLRPGFAAAAFAVLAGAVGATAIVLTRDNEVEAKEIAALARKPADRTDPAKLTVDGLRFAKWPGWKPTGARRDKLSDHDVGTVYYARRGQTVAYSIVERPSVPQPGDGAKVERKGRTYVVGKLEGRDAVVWYRNGRTCVISGVGIPRATLLRLAGYDGSASSRATRSRPRYSRVANVGGLTSSSSAASW